MPSMILTLAKPIEDKIDDSMGDRVESNTEICNMRKERTHLL